MKKPVIGISAAVQMRGENADKTVFNSAYIKAVQQAGGIPLLYPATEYSAEEAESFLDLLDGLLLPGGGDADPALYGEAALPECGTPNPDLDKLELKLVPMAAERGIPMFGICRGIQMMNVAFGGTLYQDLPSQNPGRIAHSQREGRHELTHGIEILPGTELRELYPAGSLVVNSFHHQAVKDLAPGFAVTAVAPDGVIEAMENRALGAFAVQFHPEELVGYHEGFNRLFECFVKKAAAFKARKD